MKILTCNVSDASAAKLRDVIVKITGQHFFVTKDPSMIKKRPFVRYGCGHGVNIKDTEYNSARFINLCIDKLAFANLLRKNKIYAPQFNSSGVPSKFPVLIRQSLQAHGGKGIIICRDRTEFDSNWREGYYHWTPFIKTDFEIRAYVCGDRVIKVFDKVVNKFKEKDLPIRSNYDFVDRDLSFYPKVQKLVSKIANFLPGQFYSLDMAWDAERGDYFIFEGNSGSWMSPSTAEATGAYLVKTMKL